ncbi:hypothetical protein N7452_003652 [Penicillium brevicompactum]|uniref:Uncharacterized protein n=1 Tax=Penicillium brevicompactum TaxID=5074 RepID=A0A9W9QWZ9_PENBR|nr:hypothetical protein N7452_003652 [Penicillium brevicompactum]
MIDTVCGPPSPLLSGPFYFPSFSSSSLLTAGFRISPSHLQVFSKLNTISIMSENAPADGHTDGLPNGLPNGHTDGLPNGLPNGHTDGLTNGLPNGHTDGLPNGLSNGDVDMTVNGAASANR